MNWKLEWPKDGPTLDDVRYALQQLGAFANQGLYYVEHHNVKGLRAYAKPVLAACVATLREMESSCQPGSLAAALKPIVEEAGRVAAALPYAQPA